MTWFLGGIVAGFILADIHESIRFARLFDALKTDGPHNTAPPTTAELKPRPAPAPRRNPSG